MTDLDAILRAVVADPADDTPRLVYAEICDGIAGVVACPRCGGARDRRGSGSVSNGYAERAEFVRVGIEAARTTAHCYHDLTQPPDCPVCALHLRAADLARMPVPTIDRADHRCAWEAWAGLPGFACLNLMGDRSADGIDSRLRERGRQPGNYFRFRRGFVDEVRLPLSALVGIDLAAVFAVHPIARVVLTDREPTAASHPSGAWHWTWAGNDADSRVGLPRKLMAALSASGIARVFDSRDAAMDALSLACVNLGRAAAGLDPLT